jgi:hypothetical protein
MADFGKKVRREKQTIIRERLAKSAPAHSPLRGCAKKLLKPNGIDEFLQPVRRF